MTDAIDMRRNASGAHAIADHLRACGGDFVASLRARTDIDDYAVKLCSRAERFEAHAEARLIGLVAAYANDESRRCGYISNVSVVPSWRGRGVASRLLVECVDHLRVAGFAQIELEVDRANLGALRFYAGHGFVAIDSGAAMQRLQLDLTLGDEREHRP